MPHDNRKSLQQIPPAVIAAAATVYPKHEITQYAACVWQPGDIIEIRAIKKGEVISRWYLVEHLPSKLHELAELNRSGFNVYCGVNPRPARGATGDACIQIARTFFVDFDGIDLAEAMSRVSKAGLPLPTLVVWSGHGCHLYWRTTEPMTDLAEWRRIQKGLIALLDSDKSIHNPERILRLPGWLNCKAEPTLCYIVHAAPEDRYPLETFRERIGNVAPAMKLPTPPRRHNNVMSTFTVDAHKDGQHWFERALREDHGGRNNTGLWLAVQLRDAGLNEADASRWMVRYQQQVKGGDHVYTEAEALATCRQAFSQPRREPARRMSYVAKAGDSKWFIPSHRNLGVSA